MVLGIKPTGSKHLLVAIRAPYDSMLLAVRGECVNGVFVRSDVMRKKGRPLDGEPPAEPLSSAQADNSPGVPVLIPITGQTTIATGL